MFTLPFVLLLQPRLHNEHSTGQQEDKEHEPCESLCEGDFLTLGEAGNDHPIIDNHDKVLLSAGSTDHGLAALVCGAYEHLAASKTRCALVVTSNTPDELLALRW